jgi:hypothetical protein
MPYISCRWCEVQSVLWRDAKLVFIFTFTLLSGKLATKKIKVQREYNITLLNSRVEMNNRKLVGLSKLLFQLHKKSYSNLSSERFSRIKTPSIWTRNVFDISYSLFSLTCVWCWLCSKLLSFHKSQCQTWIVLGKLNAPYSEPFMHSAGIVVMNQLPVGCIRRSNIMATRTFPICQDADVQFRFQINFSMLVFYCYLTKPASVRWSIFPW